MRSLQKSTLLILKNVKDVKVALFVATRTIFGCKSLWFNVKQLPYTQSRPLQWQQQNTLFVY
jgi:hypothetical protein